MRSLEKGVYYFGTLPEEALLHIEELLIREGWTQRCAERSQQATITWTTTPAPESLSPEAELRSGNDARVINWFSGANKIKYHPNEAPPHSSVREGVISIIGRYGRVAVCIGDDYGGGTGDDAIRPPHHATRTIVESMQAGQPAVLISIP